MQKPWDNIGDVDHEERLSLQPVGRDAWSIKH